MLIKNIKFIKIMLTNLLPLMVDLLMFTQIYTFKSTEINTKLYIIKKKLKKN